MLLRALMLITDGRAGEGRETAPPGRCKSYLDRPCSRRAHPRRLGPIRSARGPSPKAGAVLRSIGSPSPIP